MSYWSEGDGYDDVHGIQDATFAGAIDVPTRGGEWSDVDLKELLEYQEVSYVPEPESLPGQILDYIYEVTRSWLR